MLTTMVFAVVIGLLFLQINTKYLSLEISLQNRSSYKNNNLKKKNSRVNKQVLDKALHITKLNIEA